MVPLLDLILPVLLVAAATLLVSSLVGRLLPDHAKVVQGGAALLGAVQELAPGPGEYRLPLEQGRGLRAPTYHLAVMPCPTRISRWEGRAAYHLAMSILIGYLAGLALLPATEFCVVFRFTTAVAFLGYCSTSLYCWLSERRPWQSVWRPAVRGLVCSVVAGGIFAGLWPPT